MLKNYSFDEEKLRIFKDDLVSVLTDVGVKANVSLSEKSVSKNILNKKEALGIVFLVEINNENINWEKRVIITDSDNLEQIYENAKSVVSEYLIFMHKNI